MTSDKRHKILVIQIKQIGDAVLTTPVFENLKINYPNSHLTFLIDKRFACIVEGNPYIDDLILFDKKEHKGLGWGLIKEVRKRKFDMIYDFLFNTRTMWLTLFSGATHSVSYDHAIRRLIYKRSFVGLGDYSVDHKLSLLEQDGLKVQKRSPQIYLKDNDLLEAKEVLRELEISEEDRLVIFDVSHKRITRRYGAQGFADLADFLIETYNIKPLFIWGPGEEQQIEAVVQLMKNKAYIPPLTSLMVMSALISLSELLIGNCSAPRHFAVALNIPTFVFHGSTDPKSWVFPSSYHLYFGKDINCRPCGSNICKFGDQRCMHDNPLEEVISSIQPLIDLKSW